MKTVDLHWGWTNVHTTDRKCLGNVNSTFTAMICPLGTCLIFSTTPYAPRPSSMIGSRSSAFTSKFCRGGKECNEKEKNKLNSALFCPLSGFSQHSKGYFWSRSFFKQPLESKKHGEMFRLPKHATCLSQVIQRSNSNLASKWPRLSCLHWGSSAMPP